MKRKTIKFALLMIFILGAFFLVRYTGATAYLDAARMRAWIEGYGFWGPVIYILFYSIAPVLMLPGLPITVVGGILFGPVWGTVYVAIGATTGASLAFLVARYMGREWVEGMIKSTRLAELDSQVQRKGWKIVAFTRLIPLFPFNFLNYAYGLTGIRFSHYLFATFFFMLPGIVAYVVFSSSILDLFSGRVSPAFIIGLVLVVIVSLLPIIYRRYRGRAGHHPG